MALTALQTRQRRSDGKRKTAVLSPEAERAERYRRRQREGLLFAMAEVPRGLAEHMIDLGLLSESDAADPRRLGRALVAAANKVTP